MGNGKFSCRAPFIGSKLRAERIASSNETKARKRSVFDDAIKVKISVSFTIHPDQVKPPAESYENPQDGDKYIAYEDEVETSAPVPEADMIDASCKPVNEQSMSDLLSMLKCCSLKGRICT